MSEADTAASSAPTNPYAIYEVNDDLETQGVWLVDPFHRIKVARAGGRNKLFNTIYETLTKPYKRAIQMKLLPKEKDLELSRELYARACVKNWSVATFDEDGKVVKNEKGEIVWIDGKLFDPETFAVIPATPENIMRVFEVKPELYSYVVERANDVTTYRDEDEDDADVKN